MATQDNGLTKVTVNLIPAAKAALDQATLITEDTRTMTINRAVQLYAWWVEHEAAGCEIQVKHPDGRVAPVKLI